MNDLRERIAEILAAHYYAGSGGCVCIGPRAIRLEHATHVAGIVLAALPELGDSAAAAGAAGAHEGEEGGQEG